MKAEVESYGGEEYIEWFQGFSYKTGFKTVQHWTLYVDGEFICDRSGQPNDEAKLRAIAEKINKAGE